MILAGLMVLSMPGGDLSESAAGEAPFRIAFTKNIFGDIPRADALAAVKAWSETILEASGIPADSQPLISDDLDELIAALQGGEVDAVTLQAMEYFMVPAGLLEGDELFMNSRANGWFEEYVLLVHKDSGISKLEDLRGQDYVTWDHTRTSLALPWMETVLADHGLGPVEGFFGNRTGADQLAKAVLPVFFGQAKACLVTRSGFQSMAELNPQVGRQLRVLLASPGVVSSFFCFREGYDSKNRKKIEGAIEHLPESPAGRQVLTTFQCETIVRAPGSVLESGQTIFEAYRELQRQRTDLGSIGAVTGDPKGAN